MQDHAALELHVERALAQRALGGFANRREGLDQQVVERLALGQAFAELGRLAAQRLVAQLGKLRLQRVDPGDRLVEAFDDAIVGRAEQASGKRPQHENLEILMT